mmetsp:Transcript_75394/g.218961  ORF Transcript_75394/g.218961 Transcript_75394/m.218961 type:complete len:219 (+) Transcript_75394:471-1127(+)
MRSACMASALAWRCCGRGRCPSTWATWRRMATWRTSPSCICSTGSVALTSGLCGGCATTWMCLARNSVRECSKSCAATTSGVTASVRQAAAWTSSSGTGQVAWCGARTLEQSCATWLRSARTRSGAFWSAPSRASSTRCLSAVLMPRWARGSPWSPARTSRRRACRQTRRAQPTPWIGSSSSCTGRRALETCRKRWASSRRTMGSDDEQSAGGGSELE